METGWGKEKLDQYIRVHIITINTRECMFNGQFIYIRFAQFLWFWLNI